MFWSVVAGSTAAIVLFVAVDGHDLYRALRLIPAGDIFSDTFGSAMVPQAVQRMFGWSDLARYMLQSVMAGALALTTIRAGMRDDMHRDVARLTEQERNFLLAGGLLTIGCFFTAHNAGYRAIQLLLVVPTLTALFRTGGHRRAYGWAVATTVSAMWAQGWLALGVRLRDILPLPAREFDMLIWFAREACWWWTTAILAVLVTALLRRSTMVQSLFPIRARTT